MYTRRHTKRSVRGQDAEEDYEDSAHTSSPTSGSGGRRRVKTSRYETDDYDNQEQRLFQQALENSRKDQRRIVYDVPEAPVKRPTMEEFSDPIQYILSIREECEKFGICTIVPPEEWRPPFAIDIDASAGSNIRFDTKEQRIDTIQEGGGFHAGPQCNFSEYRNLADKFEKQWLSQYAKRTGNKQPTFAEIEREYWDIVETGRPETCVQYASDLDVCAFGSGFCPPPTDSSAPAVNRQDTSAAGKMKAPKVPLTTSDANFDYSRTSWNCLNLPTAKGSLLGYITERISGVNSPWLYMGMLFTSFCWHTEDNYLYSINYSHIGSPKQWYGSPASASKAFEKAIKDSYLLKMDDVPNFMYDINTQFSPSYLISRGVQVYRALQLPGSFVVTFPRCYHAGFNYGFNCNEAVNFAPPDWLPFGSDVCEKYRVASRPSVFSHERLLFTLAHHLQDLLQFRPSLRSKKASPGPNTVSGPLVAANSSTSSSNSSTSSGHSGDAELVVDTGARSAYTLLIELDKVIQSELYVRNNVIQQEQIKDMTGTVKMPRNEYTHISKKELDYDDIRSCFLCHHVCLLSAVACWCSNHKVACIRHSKALCKCPNKKKYLLVWQSSAELSELGRLVSRALEKYKVYTAAIDISNKRLSGDKAAVGGSDFRDLYSPTSFSKSGVGSGGARWSATEQELNTAQRARAEAAATDAHKLQTLLDDFSTAALLFRDRLRETEIDALPSSTTADPSVSVDSNIDESAAVANASHVELNDSSDNSNDSYPTVKVEPVRSVPLRPSVIV